MADYSESNHRALQALLRGHPEVREGRMFGFPAWFVGRRMFACLYGQGVGVKVPQAEAERLRRERGLAPFRPHGKPPMREWVQIDRARASDLGLDLDVLEAAIRHASANNAPARAPKKA